MEEVIKKRMVSLPEVKEILEKQDPESLRSNSALDI